jgi:hypothetical protein
LSGSGGPTAAIVPDGAFIAFIETYDTSSLEMIGGQSVNISSYDDSLVTISGGGGGRSAPSVSSVAGQWTIQPLKFAAGRC